MNSAGWRRVKVEDVPIGTTFRLGRNPDHPSQTDYVRVEAEELVPGLASKCWGRAAKFEPCGGWYSSRGDVEVWVRGEGAGGDGEAQSERTGNCG